MFGLAEETRKSVEKQNFSSGYENKGINGKKREVVRYHLSPNTILFPKNGEIWREKNDNKC